MEGFAVLAFISLNAMKKFTRSVLLLACLCQHINLFAWIQDCPDPCDEDPCDDSEYPLMELGVKVLVGVIAQSIENRQQTQDFDICARKWVEMNKSNEADQVEIIDSKPFYNADGNYGGQTLVKITDWSGEVRVMAMVCHGDWFYNGQYFPENIYSFELTKETFEAFLLGYFNALMGMHAKQGITSLDSIPIYEAVRTNSRRYRKYLQDEGEGKFQRPFDVWPATISRRGNKTLVYKGLSSFKELRNFTYDGYYGLISNSKSVSYWDVDFAFSKSVGFSNIEISDDLIATYSHDLFAIGSLDLGMYTISPEQFTVIAKNLGMWP
jgi:hypothetical protein